LEGYSFLVHVAAGVAPTIARNLIHEFVAELRRASPLGEMVRLWWMERVDAAGIAGIGPGDVVQTNKLWVPSPLSDF
jgi:hypothetical protein